MLNARASDKCLPAWADCESGHAFSFFRIAPFAFPSSAASVDRRRRLLGIGAILTGQVFVGQSLAGDLRERQHKASAIVHVLPVVVAEALLIQIPEQVEGLHGNVGSIQPALEQRPEVLQAVGVDIARAPGFP